MLAQVLETPLATATPAELLLEPVGLIAVGVAVVVALAMVVVFIVPFRRYLRDAQGSSRHFPRTMDIPLRVARPVLTRDGHTLREVTAYGQRVPGASAHGHANPDIATAAEAEDSFSTGRSISAPPIEVQLTEHCTGEAQQPVAEQDLTDLLLTRYNEAAAEGTPSRFTELPHLRERLHFLEKAEDAHLVDCGSASNARFWAVLKESQGYLFLSLDYFEENRSAFGIGDNRTSARSLLDPFFAVVFEHREQPQIERPASIRYSEDRSDFELIAPGVMRW